MSRYNGYEELLIEVEDSIATVTLNRPDIMNAETPTVGRELGRIWTELDNDPEVKAVILTGAGAKFSAGGDFRSMKTGAWSNGFDTDIFHNVANRVNSQLNLRVPLIAAVNGDAVGGGASLALLCDIVIIAESARFGDPHVRSGAAAGDGGAVLWTALAGPLRAKQFLMTGDLMTAAEAVQMGLANRMVPDGTTYTEARVLAKRFVSDIAPLAVKWTKYSINKLLRESMMAAFDVALALEIVSISSEDRREAIDAFLEKRKPTYKNR
jgi:enoyl-CoA hydratase